MTISEDHVERYIKLFATLSPADIDRLGDYFAPDARFKDPFNDVRGVAAIASVFRHMFEVCEQPEFDVLDWSCRNNIASIHWRFTLKLKRGKLTFKPVDGVSLVEFDKRGLATSHIDYWDPTAGVYSEIPVLGGLLRWLRKRMSTPQPA